MAKDEYRSKLDMFISLVVDGSAANGWSLTIYDGEGMRIFFKKFATAEAAMDSALPFAKGYVEEKYNTLWQQFVRKHFFPIRQTLEWRHYIETE